MWLTNEYMGGKHMKNNIMNRICICENRNMKKWKIIKSRIIKNGNKSGRLNSVILCKVCNSQWSTNANYIYDLLLRDKDFAERLPKSYKEFKFIEKYDKQILNFKLQFDSLPIYVHGKSLKNNINALWRKIRKEELINQNKTCSICGYCAEEPEQQTKLQLHEVWEIDEDIHILKLKELKMLCADCHYAFHIARAVMIIFPTREEFFEHIAKVNDCDIAITRYQFDKYFYECQLEKYLNKIYFNPNKQIDEFDWKIQVCCEMPYKDDVLKKLSIKGLLYENIL